MTREQRIRRDIVEVGRRIWLKGYVAANDGNLSARLSHTEILCTPTGVSKGFLTPHMLAKVAPDGEQIEGDMQPSSEVLMHLEMYRERPDVCGMVHAHPPTATGFAVAGLSLEQQVLPEVIISLKGIPLARYGTPATEEIPKALRPYLATHDAFLLENHGVLTLGKDIYEAYYRMETVEHFARISVTARTLGKEQTLPPPRVAELMETRAKLGLQGRPDCLGCGRCEARETARAFASSPLPPSSAPQDPTETLVRTITQEIIRRLA